MKNITSLGSIIISSLLSAAFFVSAAHAGDVDVNWTSPDDYQDIKESNFERKSQFREHLFESLELHFAKLADDLPAGSTLKIEVLDFALAGDRRIGPNEIRVVSNHYPPRIKLTYQLISADQQLLASGDDNYRDMNFMLNSSRYLPRERFLYEKVLLDKWFKRAFKDLLKTH
tara:strand:+ start:506 stop:1021 length:516 start_codon:yes stop_codon:yes gene_type:complete